VDHITSGLVQAGRLNKGEASKVKKKLLLHGIQRQRPKKQNLAPHAIRTVSRDMLPSFKPAHLAEDEAALRGNLVGIDEDRHDRNRTTSENSAGSLPNRDRTISENSAGSRTAAGEDVGGGSGGGNESPLRGRRSRGISESSLGWVLR
jgi:hypothetical protein